MDDVKFQLFRTPEFNDWLYSQTDKVQSLILARLQRLSLDGHFGFTNYFDGLIELKWKSGLRVYIARAKHRIVIVLGGGNKNGQNKDIKQAKKILEQIQNSIFRNS